MVSDLVFEAMCEVCQIDWQAGMTKDARGRVNAALKQLRDTYGDEGEAVLPMMIRERAVAWAVCYPEIPLTPQALTSNWAGIIQAAEHQQSRRKEAEQERRRVTNAHARSGCTTCGDDHVVVIGADAQGHDLTAPCPDCNPHANAAYWVERRKIEPMDSAKVREFLDG